MSNWTYPAGMSHEKLYPSEPHKALQAYSSALPLFTLAASDVSAQSASPTIPMSSFTYGREMWRWVERLIWRAVILCARTQDLHASGGDGHSIWTWLSGYSGCSASWPADFRTVHRSTISSLFLRALILRHAPSPAMRIDPEKSPPWLHTARSVVNDDSERMYNVPKDWGTQC